MQDIGSTQPQPKDNPVFNERFQFEVQDEDVIHIKIIDSQIQGLQCQTDITMKDLREYMDDQTIEIKELWFDF